MLQRIRLITIIVAACSCCSAHSQTKTAGCTICPGQGSGAGSSSGNTKAAGNPQNRTAAAMNAMQNNLQTNTQMINNAGTAILNALQPNNNSDAGTTSNSSDDISTEQPTQPDASAPDSAALGAANAAAAARQREQINTEAAQILQDSQNTMESMDSADSGGAAPNSAAAVNSLLGASAPSSNAVVNSLLGTPSQPGVNPADAVGSLLDISKVSDSASAFPAYVPLATPADPQFAAAMQNSTNQPNPGADISLIQNLRGEGEAIQDQLLGLVSSGKTLVSNVMSNRFVQWGTSDQGDFTTVPLPAPSDSPDTAANLVYGQSVTGFGTILKECVQSGPEGCAKGIYGYGSAMVNQMGADLGYAQVNIVQNPNTDPSK